MTETTTGRPPGHGTPESLEEVRALVEAPNAEALAGFRIGVTSDRRSDDLISALERRGAQVLHAPALRIAPVAEDRALLQDTAAILHARPDATMITTAYGMRRWSEAADVHGLGEELMETLGASRIFVRGPKARGAVRAAGLNDAGISHDERTSSLVDLLLGEGVAGSTVAVQLHGYTDDPAGQAPDAGARVLTVTPYRWVKPAGRRRSADSSRRPSRGSWTWSPSPARRPSTRCSAPRMRWAGMTRSWRRSGRRRCRRRRAGHRAPAEERESVP